ncbi:AMI005Wp (mitochondrion) [Eremothecium gossypii ATCC 10895]|uniref:ATP synthase protein 8 n=1 Tax=Eremothecium gossypii (strain ATCC 10895 / CBS 109.51 / FGSC 9923 / NRRL Y-1056) TaxID=284811 RepID=ATP8_EREGS|nr:AMI005Wp [Eremothecium gossypii ATCC 10895]YP_005097968.1 ATP synthase subunit 8 [Eremothecium gossypii FDAG1]Q75G40.1 RecName: Full=ATP synthase protein 8; AltName: Full=F-ATPase subunit 8 [Eremothecium gossypii ATCC 10895]AAS50172.1 AMI005Wp [Eremothecium gossypii ATCC 10895]AEY99235.1 ATP synthase subunit 8 [Eremothecium gossypii FDAG1]
MPQMIPFFFMNQLTYGFTFILTILFLTSYVFLPMILRLYISRLYISKL